MKVWIVWNDALDEYTTIVAVFDSEAKAIAFCGERAGNYTWDEFEVE